MAPFRPSRAPWTLAATLVAALLPFAASAANGCPAVGTSVYVGSCAPRDWCERYDVISHSRQYGNWGYNARVYRRNSQGWYYVTTAWTLCRYP